MSYRQRILVIRLSALGDVAILQPILQLRAEANPDILFMLAAPKLLAPLFAGIDNVQFVPTIKKQSSRALYRQLAALQPTMVADMHHVNRVIGADWLFRLHGIPVHTINKHCDKGKPSWKRYDEVFDRCGLSAPIVPAEDIARDYWQPKGAHEGPLRIGFAPFAQHEGKIWPQERMVAFVECLSCRGGYDVELFGGREDALVLDELAERIPHVRSMAGKLRFEEELRRIAELDVMVSMDSANMHFASCLGVPVVSIWGATHPSRGFYGWRQNPAWAVQAERDCRPCSKYGNRPCRYGDYPCLKSVTVGMVVERLDTLVKR